MTLHKQLQCTAVGQTLSSLMWLQISSQAEDTEMPFHTQMQGQSSTLAKPQMAAIPGQRGVKSGQLVTQEGLPPKQHATA